MPKRSFLFRLAAIGADRVAAVVLGEVAPRLFGTVYTTRVFTITES